MKTFAEHILTEIGDEPMTWNWSEWGEFDGVTTAFSDKPQKMFVAVAETRTRPIPRPDVPRAAKRYVKVTFGEWEPGKIIVGFVTKDENDNPTDDVTGLGDAFKIFSTVQDIIRAFVKRFGKKNIKVLRIDGRKEGRGNVSRTKLYGRFAQQFAREIGGKVVKSDTSSREIFDIQLAEPVNEGPGKRSESWEKGYERRVVRTTKPEHKEKGYNWRIKGKERSEISIKLYKTKPSFEEFKKQMRRVAGHEFGSR